MISSPITICWLASGICRSTENCHCHVVVEGHNIQVIRTLKLLHQRAIKTRCIINLSIEVVIDSWVGITSVSIYHINISQFDIYSPPQLKCSLIYTMDVLYQVLRAWLLNKLEIIRRIYNIVGY